jgi:hypothetical protein
MQALLFPVFDFFARNRWAQLALAIVVTIATLGLYLAWRDNGVRKREREKHELEAAKERERLLQTSRKEIDDVEAAKDAAIAAPDLLPEFTGADELRDKAPDIASVILRNRS